MDPNQVFIEQHLAYLLPFIFIFGLFMIAVIVFPLWRICGRAGFSPWLCLLVFVPFGAIILLYVLAFARWNVVPAPQVGALYPPYPPPPGYPPTTYTPVPAQAPPPVNPYPPN